MPDFIQNIENAMREWLGSLEFFGGAMTFITRFIYAPLALLIFIRCLWPLMSGGIKPRPWAWLVSADGARYPLSHWENSIGRGKNCDVVLELPSISRSHAVISRRREQWAITDLESKSGVLVNGQKCEGQAALADGDVIGIAGVELTLRPADAPIASRLDRRGFAAWAAGLAARFRPGSTLALVMLFQLIGLVELALAQGSELSILVPFTMLMFFALELAYYLVSRAMGRRYAEPELLAFFLCGMGLFVAGTVNPVTMIKQFAAVLLGMALFLVLTYFLNNIERARVARYVFAAGGLLLLAVNLLIAPTRFGARNWIELGPITIQPSELVKVAFVFAGGATLERLLTRRNLLMFMGFSAACIGAMILMRDFGGAVVFFLTFLVIVFMRSGDIKTVIVVSVAAGAGAVIAMSFLPYIADRFSTWRHAWEYAATTGYQQTRTMVYTASGGLFGVGAGNGYLRYVAAADTDLVFGLVAEEWGIIVALVCAFIPLALAIFAANSVKACRSSFYAIAACGAATVMLTQTALNIFGSLDILPLTGVTFPFLSSGGTSMMACWGLMACIKSIDERHRAQNPVLATRGKKGGVAL